jgi:hypothetical protein
MGCIPKTINVRLTRHFQCRQPSLSTSVLKRSGNRHLRLVWRQRWAAIAAVASGARLYHPAGAPPPEPAIVADAP